MLEGKFEVEGCVAACSLGVGDEVEEPLSGHGENPHFVLEVDTFAQHKALASRVEDILVVSHSVVSLAELHLIASFVNSAQKDVVYFYAFGHGFLKVVNSHGLFELKVKSEK